MGGSRFQRARPDNAVVTRCRPERLARWPLLCKECVMKFYSVARPTPSEGEEG